MDYFSKIKDLDIFAGMSISEIRALNFCIKSTFIKYKKNEIIVAEDTPLDYFYLIISGIARTVTNNYSGDETIISEYKKGQVFGLEEALSGRQKTKYNLIATSDCEVMRFSKSMALKTCENNCLRHRNFKNSLIELMAKKNLDLCERVNLMTQKSTKEKVLSYLQSVSKKSVSPYFDIPYNRQELADYLSVDRSALSFELSKLKTHGILDYDKNHFMLKKVNKNE